MSAATEEADLRSCEDDHVCMSDRLLPRSDGVPILEERSLKGSVFMRKAFCPPRLKMASSSGGNRWMFDEWTNTGTMMLFYVHNGVQNARLGEMLP